MKKFENKTLLVLGSSTGSVDIVNYAKENGAYTIVADYYPPEKSEAKQIADEAVEISTGDIEKLSEFIKNRKILYNYLCKIYYDMEVMLLWIKINGK